jgi:hypothetical protein
MVMASTDSLVSFEEKGEIISESVAEQQQERYVFTTTGEKRVVRWPRCSWTDLMRLIDEDRLDEITRTQETLLLYAQHRELVREEYWSLEDYIKIHELGFEYQMEMETGRKMAKTTRGRNFDSSSLFAASSPSPSSSAWIAFERGGLLLTKNKFPYDLDPSIDHYLLWKIPSFSSTLSSEEQGEQEEQKPLDISMIEKFLMESGLRNNSKNIRYFFNPPRLQSVQGVPHCQLMVLK